MQTQTFYKYVYILFPGISLIVNDAAFAAICSFIVWGL